MTATTQPDLAEYCLQTAQRAKRASADLAQAGGAAKNDWLRDSAARLREQAERVLAANAQDIAAAPGFGLTDAAIDRLRLSAKRIDEIARGLEEVAALPDPVGEVIESSIRPNGLQILKTRVPLGVVFFIYESRPNVTADAAAICLKSGNAVILRGGKEAAHSSRAIVEILTESAEDHELPDDAIHLVETADRAAVGHFLGLPQLIDVAIPRGGESLIRRVAAEAKMPVIKHFTGNCHVYVDAAADLAMAERIVVNAKCQRLGVCNACESLLVHAAVAEPFLKAAGPALISRGIEIRGCERTSRLVPTAKKATDEDYAAEFLGPIISVKVVDSLGEAIEHINRFGSQHTDAIVTGDLAAARQFTARVDSSAVMVNASTRFNDGYEFGLGAEIGISTDKFHARGPCGLKELTTYKYVVFGDGQIREQQANCKDCTMADDVLSQAEVESLITAMESHSPLAKAAPALAQTSRGGAKQREKIVTYDFKRPERVGKEQMRALQSLHEGFGRNFGAALSALLRSIVEVKLTSVDQLTYSEFVFSLENPTCFSLLRAEPLEGNLILDINPSILYPIIDRLLGGGKDLGPISRRPLTEIELRLVGRITGLFLQELKHAWENVLTLKLSVERVESNPQLVQIVPPNEVVILVSFELGLGDVRGMINLCIPFNSIERVSAKLAANTWASYNRSGSTPESRALIGGRLDRSNVDVVVTLAESKLTTGDLIGLRVGDIITTDKDVRTPIDVAVQGVNKFLASPGALKGSRAIRIEAAQASAPAPQAPAGSPAKASAK